MTDAEIIQHLRDEYRTGRRRGRVREPEWRRLVAIAWGEHIHGLTFHGTWAEYDPLGNGDAMLIFGDHFSVRITP